MFTDNLRLTKRTLHSCRIQSHFIGVHMYSQCVSGSGFFVCPWLYHVCNAEWPPAVRFVYADYLVSNPEWPLRFLSFLVGFLGVMSIWWSQWWTIMRQLFCMGSSGDKGLLWFEYIKKCMFIAPNYPKVCVNLQSVHNDISWRFCTRVHVYLAWVMGGMVLMNGSIFQFTSYMYPCRVWSQMGRIWNKNSVLFYFLEDSPSDSWFIYSSYAKQSGPL